MPECPVCAADVSLTDDAVVGELMECLDCGTELWTLLGSVWWNGNRQPQIAIIDFSNASDTAVSTPTLFLDFADPV